MNGKKTHLGYFTDPSKAAKAYEASAAIRDKISSTPVATVTPQTTPTPITPAVSLSDAPWGDKTQNMSLQALVESVINYFVGANQSFSAYDVTVKAREMVNDGRVYVIGLAVEILPGTAQISQQIFHDSVRNIVRNSLPDTVLAGMGYEKDFSGDSYGTFVLYKPAETQVADDVVDVSGDGNTININVDGSDVDVKIDGKSVDVSTPVQDTPKKTVPLVVKWLTLGLYKGKRN